MEMENVICAKISKDGWMLQIRHKSVGRKIGVLASTVPLTVRNRILVDNFYILPFGKEKRGLILLFAETVEKMQVTYLARVSMQDRAPYLHIMNKDSLWEPSMTFPTQIVDKGIEVMVHDKRFTSIQDQSDDEVFSVDSGLLLDYLNGNLSPRELEEQANSKPRSILLDEREKELNIREKAVLEREEKLKRRLSY